ncbi:MAG: hypothetical protein E7382_02745 [Clostridiales bacterium]|nr:hypothetical protein [Clostridiales bacterium]
MKQQRILPKIDVHTHILPNVDDGSISFANSMCLLKDCVDNGVTDVILTPHYRAKYRLDSQEIKDAFVKFSEQVKNEGLAIRLYLGQEIFADRHVKELVTSAKVLPLADSKYLLVEFDFVSDTDIVETVYELKRLGYNVIVAHIERYTYADLNTAFAVKDAGGLIQVNSNAIVGKNRGGYKKKVKELFKAGLVDFVASDVHVGREYTMEKACQYVAKKFGEDVALDVFYNNAKKILEG